MININLTKKNASWPAVPTATQYRITALAKKAGARVLSTVTQPSTIVQLSSVPLTGIQADETPHLSVEALDATGNVVDQGEIRLPSPINWGKTILLIFIALLVLILGYIAFMAWNRGSNPIDPKIDRKENVSEKIADKKLELPASPAASPTAAQDKGAIPAATTTRPDKGGDGPKEAPPLYGKDRVERLEYKAPVIEWPRGEDPQFIKNILSTENAYDKTVECAFLDDTLAAGVDVIYRYPIGWLVEVDTDPTRVFSAFNLGTERNPTWVLTKDYIGGSVQSLRLKVIDQQPLKITFRLTRMKR